MTTSSLIQRAVEESGSTDPREVAEIVAGLTPDSEVRGFYAKQLVQEVRMYFSEQRRAVFKSAGKADRTFLGPAKTQASVARDWWQEFTQSRVHVGGALWKSLGECTADDLAVAFAEREAHARSVLDEAQKFLWLSKLLGEAGVSTVAELDVEAVRGLFA